MFDRNKLCKLIQLYLSTSFRLDGQIDIVLQAVSSYATGVWQAVQFFLKFFLLKNKEPVFGDHKKQDQLNKKGRVETTKPK